MILCNLNSFQLSYLNTIVKDPIFSEVVAVRTGDTKTIIEWRDTLDFINIWEIDLCGNIEILDYVKPAPLPWERLSNNAAYLEGTIIDLDDEYMFERYEAALEDA